MLPANFNDYFKNVKIIHSYLKTIFLPKFSNKSGHKSLAYQGSKLWTEIPLCLKNLSEFGKIQDELKSYLLNCDYQGHK